MPEFFDVCHHFDDTALYDGYSAALLYYGQYSSFDESSPDGNITKRRTLSLSPNYSLPSRRVLSILGERWIAGDGNSDALHGAAMRRNYWLKKVTDTVNLLTPAQVCASASGTVTHVSKEFLKDTVNAVSDSGYDNFWLVYLAPAEPISKSRYIKTDTSLLRVRSTHSDEAGFLVASCDELDSASLVTAVFAGSGSFDPVTETYSGGSVSQVGILFDAYKAYEYKTLADPKVNAGDLTLVVTNSVAPGALVAIGSDTYRVLSQQVELDAYSLHLRKP